MGMDAHALVAIGFEITQEDFLQPVKDTKKTCDYGHPLPPRDPELLNPSTVHKMERNSITE